MVMLKELAVTVRCLGWQCNDPCFVNMLEMKVLIVHGVTLDMAPSL